ncbi:UNVERIFIED_CONTAM: putative disease resistance RPP13-like protein 1 [Sesamum radiatum]|uniref:Disease resistance RPP13-like protein 1 n=1 Tax=Sesamum radiatum TaxID=300843 RepID=A0AAW2PI25_SESRA
MSVFAILERLAPRIEKEVNLVLNSKQEAETLSSKLKKIQVGLEDAEKKAATDGNQIYKYSFKALRIWLILGRRIDKILEEKGKYKFVSGESVQSSESNQDESTPAVNKLEVCGRELETNSLIEKLVPEGKNNDVGTKIISIVGTGGVGKTTLAQLAFNDPKVQDNFEDKAWVSVSNPFSASEVAKAILEAVGKSSADVLKLNTLGQMIKEALEKRRFLLVLDNMWLENRMEWDRLNYLHGAPGSRILVTTRSESVARMIGTTEWQQLGLLSDLDCGTILNGIALHGRTQEECEKLKDIEWLDVLENPLWKYEDEVSDLFRLLKLSYIDLSPLLKRCFLSCIVCPKGTSVNVDELIRIWMAYGYLSSSHSAQEVRSKGLEKCHRLSRLPEGIDKLINLRHILNSGAYDLKQFPQGLEKLTGLWTLSEFTVMEASELGYLGNLNQLHGSIFISLQGLNDSTDSLEQVRKANLKSKNHIQKLELLFHDEVLTDDVMGALEPPPNLQSLGVKCKTGKWLPKWINATCFNSLKVVKFNGRGRCFDLPPFGKLPGLEKLVIINCDFNCLSKELLGIRFVLEDGPSKASPEWAGWSPWSGYSPNVRPPMLTSSDGAGRFPGSDNVIKVRPSVPTSSVGACRFPGSDNVIKVRPSVPTTSVGAGRFPGPDNVIKVGPSVPTSAVGAGWFPGSANITKVRPAFPTSSQVVGWFPDRLLSQRCNQQYRHHHTG